LQVYDSNDTFRSAFPHSARSSKTLTAPYIKLKKTPCPPQQITIPEFLQHIASLFYCPPTKTPVKCTRKALIEVKRPLPYPFVATSHQSKIVAPRAYNGPFLRPNRMF
jgi:hypothetical protein